MFGRHSLRRQYLIKPILFTLFMISSSAYADAPVVTQDGIAPNVVYTSTFAVDIYIAVMPVEGEPGSLAIYYSPGDALVVDRKALGKSGIAKLDSKIFVDANKLIEKVDTLIKDVNVAYHDCAVVFKKRHIYLINATKKEIKSHYADQYFEMLLHLKDGESQLLHDFDIVTSGSSGAFKILMADLAKVDGERGSAVHSGHVSVVHMASALDPLAHGQHVVHQLAHNFGIPDNLDADPFVYAMSPKEPNRRTSSQRLQHAKVRFTDLECEKIKTVKADFSASHHADHQERKVSAVDNAELAVKFATETDKIVSTFTKPVDSDIAVVTSIEYDENAKSYDVGADPVVIEQIYPKPSPTRQSKQHDKALAVSKVKALKQAKKDAQTEQVAIKLANEKADELAAWKASNKAKKIEGLKKVIAQKETMTAKASVAQAKVAALAAKQAQITAEKTAMLKANATAMKLEAVKKSAKAKKWLTVSSPATAIPVVENKAHTILDKFGAVELPPQTASIAVLPIIDNVKQQQKLTPKPAIAFSDKPVKAKPILHKQPKGAKKPSKAVKASAESALDANYTAFFEEADQDILTPPARNPHQLIPEKISIVSVGYNTQVGELNRSRIFLPIRYEADGVVTRLFPVTRDRKNVRGDGVDLKVNLSGDYALTHYFPSLERSILGLFAVNFHYDTLRSEMQRNRDLIESMGDTLGVLSPLPDESGFTFPNGSSSAANIDELHYRDRYSEHKAIVSVDFLQINQPKKTIISRIGVMYGMNSERNDLSLTTFGGTQAISFSNKLDTDRIAVILGSQVVIPLSEYVAVHLDGEYRRVKNDTEVKALFFAEGSLDAEQRAKFSQKRYDDGYKAGAGFSIAFSESMAITGSAKFEAWQVPVLEYPVSNTSDVAFPLGLDWRNRTSWTVSAGFIYNM